MVVEYVQEKTVHKKKIMEGVAYYGMILVFILILSIGQWALKAGINLSLSAVGNSRSTLGEDNDGL